MRFFNGSVEDAVERIERGGLLVVPAAPALKDIDRNVGYREALLNADLCLTDSAFMVLIWNRISKQKIHRLSGLKYLRELLRRDDAHQPGNVVWIMASAASAEKNLRWLRGQGIEVPAECVYVAPMYGKEIEDPSLLELLERVRPQHVMVTVGGGTQERLGLFVKQRLSYRASIHCIGAAIAFLSGDQVGIPVWADRFYLGWLFRTLADPKRFGPRYWDARKLLKLMLLYRDRLPELVELR
ncbi:MAG TPA: WecB/TagA/CpsF family glycosyltransferase [Candidatus Aquilonibacter sp.]|nr:WecB/TagA/CpsF family glycosyltransferase [Candidatus Aquilonibacter sp.]